MIAFLGGDSGSDVNAVEDALNAQALILPPVVLTEILSDPKPPKQVVNTLLGLSMLDILPGYWERAGNTRAEILVRKFSSSCGCSHCSEPSGLRYPSNHTR